MGGMRAKKDKVYISKEDIFRSHPSILVIVLLPAYLCKEKIILKSIYLSIMPLKCKVKIFQNFLIMSDKEGHSFGHFWGRI